MTAWGHLPRADSCVSSESLALFKVRDGTTNLAEIDDAEFDQSMDATGDGVEQSDFP
jgi:hypothetical protein